MHKNKLKAAKSVLDMSAPWAYRTGKNSKPSLKNATHTKSLRVNKWRRETEDIIKSNQVRAYNALLFFADNQLLHIPIKTPMNSR